jgi:hypothetical protein
MKSRAAALALAVAIMSIAASVYAQPAENEAKGPSDDEIRRLLIQASIAAYNGACPCPETRNAQGERCGRNSAYSRGGGNRPLCYPSDVSNAMVERFRGNTAAP